MKNKFLIFTILLSIFIAVACGLNSVTKVELEQVKAGDVLVYRYQKGGRSWFYADKITRIEDDRVFFNPGKMEATSGTDGRLDSFLTDKESLISKAELLKYETEQGTDRKVIIWIK